MRTIGMLALTVLVFAQTGQALVLVYDAANHVSNTTTSLQTAISAAQSIIHTANWVLDLTGLDGVLGAKEYYEDLMTMQMLLRDARAIAGDIGSIARQVNHLFSLNTAPDNTSDWYKRQQEIDQTLWDVYSYATATQRLVATIDHTITHIRQFWDRIGALIGDRQTLQSLNESQAKMIQAQEKNALMTAAFERAETYQRLQEPLRRESWRRINEQLMGDYPTAVQ